MENKVHKIPFKLQCKITRKYHNQRHRIIRNCNLPNSKNICQQRLIKKIKMNLTNYNQYKLKIHLMKINKLKLKIHSWLKKNLLY